jgi:phosphodiesterase/alkaline phosphatase D-like protein
MVDIRYTKGPGRRRVTGVVYPPGVTVDDIRNAVPGSSGQVRVQYKDTAGDRWIQTPWQPVDPAADYTRQFRLSKLRPHTRYEVRVECRSGPDAPRGSSLAGNFCTAPDKEDSARVVFTVSTGQAYRHLDQPDGFKIYGEMLKLEPHFYRTYRWGRDLHIWLMEGRDFRSPNPMPDGPDKTIWGAKQKAWFKRTVQESDATFRVLISPTPIVGPDRPNKNDNHSNKGFTHEGDEVRRFIARQKNMVVVCGDRHWQYVSVHPETGVREYSCGPASDLHAGGWRQENFVKDYHRYLNVIGGFLAGTVEREDGVPSLTFRHHDVNGRVQFEDRLIAR